MGAGRSRPPSPLEARELTAAETKWVAKLQALMDKCPDTLCLATHGYSYLMVWDREMVKSAESGELCGGAAEDFGIQLTTVHTPCSVHGVSG